MTDISAVTAVVTTVTTNEIKEWNLATVEGVLVRVEVELALLKSFHQVRGSVYTKLNKVIKILEEELAERILLEGE